MKATAATVLACSAALANGSNAGLQQWSFNHHDHEVPVAIWHPAKGTTTPIAAGPFTLQAVSNGDIEQRQHPLIIISHGTGGSNIAHHPIAESLAAAGFIVAALTHPGDNFQDRSLVADERYFEERPRQVHALLRSIAADEKWGDLIDTNRIGAIGHSAGGYGVAAAIGAEPDRQNLVSHCNEVSDDPSCRYRDPSIGIVMETDKPFLMPETMTAATQLAPSIHAAVLLAPLGSVVSADSHINKDVPVLIITAEHDEVLPAQYHLSKLQLVAPHAESRVEKGAGHFSFIAPVNDTWATQLAEVAVDPDGFNRTAFNAKLGEELSAWFIKKLQP